VRLGGDSRPASVALLPHAAAPPSLPEQQPQNQQQSEAALFAIGVVG